MINRTTFALLLSLSLVVAGCGDDDDDSGAAGAAGTGQAAGAGGGAGEAGAAGEAGSGDAGTAGAAGEGAGAAGDGGAAGSSAAGAGGGGGAAGAGGDGCTTVYESLLGPIDQVSTGVVKVVKEDGGVKLLYVDASAGGSQAAASNPRVYLSLATGARVDVTDVQARTDATWDLSIKRVILFTNSGEAGPGQGGAVQLDKAFEEVTAADAPASVAAEDFYSEDCIASVDETNAVKTTFSGWYNYDETTHIPTPKGVTYVVKGADGKLYKVAIASYQANDDGTAGQATGRYLLKVAAL